MGLIERLDIGVTIARIFASRGMLLQACNSSNSRALTLNLGRFLVDAHRMKWASAESTLGTGLSGRCRGPGARGRGADCPDRCDTSVSFHADLDPASLAPSTKARPRALLSHLGPQQRGQSVKDRRRKNRRYGRLKLTDWLVLLLLLIVGVILTGLPFALFHVPRSQDDHGKYIFPDHYCCP